MLLRLIPMILLLLPVAGASAADVSLENVGRFRQPVYVTSPPGATRTLVVVERYGRIRQVVRGRVARKPLADLRSRVLVANPDEEIDQRGLFSVAFPREYRRSGRFYVDYVDRSGRQRIDELRRGSRRVRRVLDLGPVTTQHHGGQLQFGPDGLLYASTGTGEGPGPGTILRFDPRHPRPEVYATGLRNPWRFSFDRGSLLIGDVGDRTWEEVDLVPSGAPAGTDFGWPAVEGPGGPMSPALAHRHEDGWCAITGGYVVRDRRLPALAGRYLYGDLCSGKLWSARFDGTALEGARPLGRTVASLVSFGEDARGRIYTVSFRGDVFRLTR
jgi:glucose/arabinose dehydrogenase